MDFNTSKLLILGFVSAIGLHHLVLRKVEVDHWAIPIIVTSCVVYGTLVYYINLGSATLVAASFWIPLWVLIGAYRAFFHPLRHYSGPPRAKLSKWWTVKQNWDTNLHFHRAQQRMQKEYGDYVRTGIFLKDGTLCMQTNEAQAHESLPSSMWMPFLQFLECSRRRAKDRFTISWKSHYILTATSNFIANGEESGTTHSKPVSVIYCVICTTLTSRSTIRLCT
jgi:hypothetical protein